MTGDPKDNFSHTDIVRMYEASCTIAYPSDEDKNFRFALEKLIAERLGLAALKNKTLTGPHTGKGPPANATPAGRRNV